MSLQYFDRYQYFNDNGEWKIVPGIEIPIKTTDRYHQYKRNKDRLDKLSETYYNTPLFGWLILLANPDVGSMECDISDNVLLRIPHPLIESLQDYKRLIEIHSFYYGD